MKTLNVAVLGLGRSGRDIHGSYLMTAGRKFHVAAVVDPMADRRERAAKEFQCEVYPDYQALLGRKDIALIVNALPSNMHVPVSLKFLKAGFHVLCEKPLARKAAEVDALIAAAKRARRVLAIFQQAHYSPYFTRLQKLLASGVLGRIVEIRFESNSFYRRWDWQTLKAMDGGSLLNTGSHLLEQALFLYGAGMPNVCCFMDRTTTFGDADDHVKVLLGAPGKPIVDVEVSSCSPYSFFLFNVNGTRGGVKGDGDTMEWQYYRPSEAPKRKLIRRPLRDAQGLPLYCREKLKMHEGAWKVPAREANREHGGCREFYDVLYRAITAGGKLDITPEMIRRQTAIIEECQRQNPQIYG